MTNITMNRRNKKGISTVLTTLIIVVASVVLGTAVTLFGTSLFQTGAQSQEMSVTNANMWQGLNGTNTIAEGAVVVRNSGDKIVAVDSIQTRGAIVPFSSWFASTTADATPANTQKQFKYMSAPLTDLDLDNDTVPDLAAAMTRQTGPISIEPGKAVIIYFVVPVSNNALTTDDVISSVDVGAALSLKMTAGQITQVQSINVAKNT